MKYSEARELMKPGMRVKIIKCPVWERYKGVMVWLSSYNPLYNHFHFTKIQRPGSDGCFCRDDDELDILTEADGVTPWKDPRVKQTFEVGDRVKFTGQRDEKSVPDFDCDPKIPGEKIKHGSVILGEQYETEFAKVAGLYKKWVLVEYTDFNDRQVCLGFSPSNLEKVYTTGIDYAKPKSEGTVEITLKGDGLTITPPKKGFMSNIVQKIKDLALSDTDRILRKHDLEDESGKMTSEARTMVSDDLMEERWATRREDIASKLKQIDEAEKK